MKILKYISEYGNYIKDRIAGNRKFEMTGIEALGIISMLMAGFTIMMFTCVEPKKKEIIKPPDYSNLPAVINNINNEKKGIHINHYKHRIKQGSHYLWSYPIQELDIDEEKYGLIKQDKNILQSLKVLYLNGTGARFYVFDDKIMHPENISSLLTPNGTKCLEDICETIINDQYQKKEK